MNSAQPQVSAAHGRPVRSRCLRIGIAGGAAAAAVAAGSSLAYAQPEFEPRGRLHLDATAAAAEDDVPWSEGFLNRRARLGVGGTLDDNWDFQIEFDFSEEGVSANNVRMRRTLPVGRLAIGQFKEPMGLNELTSSNNITFMERSSPTNIVTPTYRLGVGYDYWEDMFGVQTMLFGKAIGDGVDGDMPLGIGARGVLSPAVGAGTLHVGLSGAFENFRQLEGVGFSDRPEIRGADGGTRLINTGAIAAADSLARGGLELAFISGPFSIEAEYLALMVERDGDDSLLFDGFHVQASYVLTGESRGYSSGAFGDPDPEGDYGAWEIAARFSHMSLDDEEIDGGVQNTVTGGLNWYVTDTIRFMVNNVTAIVDDGVFGDETVNITGIRAQYSF